MKWNIRRLGPAGMMLVLLYGAFAAAQDGAPRSGSYPEPAAEPAPPMAEPTPRPDGRITVMLRDGSRLIGEPAELEELRLETEYGDLTIPLAKIDGIRIGSYPYGSDRHEVEVLFKNGDTLAGHMRLGRLKLNTSFGDVEIPSPRLASLVMSPEWKAWVADGRGWKLIPLAESAPGRAPTFPTAASAYRDPYPAGYYEAAPSESSSRPSFDAPPPSPRVPSPYPSAVPVLPSPSRSIPAPFDPSSAAPPMTR